MTIKETRARQLDELKEHGAGEVLYCVALLNSSFMEYERKVFQRLEEAEGYAESIHWERPAFIRKYAIVSF